MHSSNYDSSPISVYGVGPTTKSDASIVHVRSKKMFDESIPKNVTRTIVAELSLT